VGFVVVLGHGASCRDQGTLNHVGGVPVVDSGGFQEVEPPLVVGDLGRSLKRCSPPIVSATTRWALSCGLARAVRDACLDGATPPGLSGWGKLVGEVRAVYGLVVRFTLLEGSGEAFDRLADETLALVKEREPGTLVYACHEVEGEPMARVFYELYSDRAAFEAHERQDHIRRFLAGRGQYLADVRVDRLDVLRGGKGVPAEAGS